MYKTIDCLSIVAKEALTPSVLDTQDDAPEIPLVIEHMSALENALKSGDGQAFIRLYEHQDDFGSNAILKLKSESFSISYAVVLGVNENPTDFHACDLYVNGVHASDWAYDRLDSGNNEEYDFVTGALNGLAASGAASLLESITVPILQNLIVKLDIAQHFWKNETAL